DIRAVRVADRDDPLRIEAVGRARLGNECGKVVCPLPQVVEVEHALRQPAEKPGHTVFKHLAAWAEQRRLWVQRPSQVEQVVLVAAGAVQQEQRGRVIGLPRNKLVYKWCIHDLPLIKFSAKLYG